MDRDTDDEDNDSQLPQNQRIHHKILSMTSTVPSIAAGSASDRVKHPFGFHHDQQPRRYIRKSYLSSTSAEDRNVIWEDMMPVQEEPRMNTSKSSPHQLLSARQPPPSAINSSNPLSLGMCITKNVPMRL